MNFTFIKFNNVGVDSFARLASECSRHEYLKQPTHADKSKNVSKLLS
jgi:hypothetical protein